MITISELAQVIADLREAAERLRLDEKSAEAYLWQSIWKLEAAAQAYRTSRT
jgi:hypothetical protein